MSRTLSTTPRRTGRSWFAVSVGLAVIVVLGAGPLSAGSALASGNGCEPHLVTHTPGSRGAQAPVSITSQHLEQGVEGWRTVSWAAAPGTTITAVTAVKTDGTTTSISAGQTGSAVDVLSLRFCGTAEVDRGEPDPDPTDQAPTDGGGEAPADDAPADDAPATGGDDGQEQSAGSSNDQPSNSGSRDTSTNDQPSTSGSSDRSTSSQPSTSGSSDRSTSSQPSTSASPNGSTSSQPSTSGSPNGSTSNGQTAPGGSTADDDADAAADDTSTEASGDDAEPDDTDRDTQEPGADAQEPEDPEEDREASSEEAGQSAGDAASVAGEQAEEPTEVLGVQVSASDPGPALTPLLVVLLVAAVLAGGAGALWERRSQR